MTILITGATGTIGTQTLKALEREGATALCGVRTPRGEHDVKLDLEDTASLDAALKGVTQLLLITPFVEHFEPGDLANLFPGFGQHFQGLAEQTLTIHRSLSTSGIE